MQSLSKIGSILGHSLKTDKYTKEKAMLKYARLMVEMSLDGQFPEHVEFANEKGILIRQKVIYEWLPTKCDKCKMFGHMQEQCKKQEKKKKEWRVKATNSTSSAALQEEGTANEAEPRDEDGFQPVTRHRQNMPRREELLDPMKLTNTYNVLMDGDEPQEMEGKRGECYRFN